MWNVMKYHKITERDNAHLQTRRSFLLSRFFLIMIFGNYISPRKIENRRRIFFGESPYDGDRTETFKSGASEVRSKNKTQKKSYKLCKLFMNRRTHGWHARKIH